MYSGQLFMNLMGRYGGGARGKRRQNSAVNRQMLIERMYIRVLSEMCIARFKWEGLEDNPKIASNELFVERELMYGGLLLFYYDRRYDKFLTPRATTAGQMNLYDEPTMFKVQGTGFLGGRVSAAKGVPIWGSISRIPDWDIITLYAHKLATLDRTIEVNSRNARQMRIVESSSDQRLTMANIDKAMDEGAPAIFVEKMQVGAQLMDGITAVDLGVDVDHIEKLHILKVRLWNELMGLLGIDGANQDKKERLVSNEVEANAEQINLNKSRALLTRRRAVDEINSKFGLDLYVDYNTQDEGSTGFNTQKGSE